MRKRIAAGLVLASALAAPVSAQDLAGWTCVASDGSGSATLQYDARRRLQLETSSVSWGTPAGPLRIAFNLPMTAQDRVAAAPAELEVTATASGGPTPQWLEIVADGRSLFSGPLPPSPYEGAAGMVFRAGPKPQAAVVAGAWRARSLRVRFLDAERRSLADATFVLPPADRRAVPLRSAFTRAQSRFGDPKVCRTRYWTE